MILAMSSTSTLPRCLPALMQCTVRDIVATKSPNAQTNHPKAGLKRSSLICGEEIAMPSPMKLRMSPRPNGELSSYRLPEGVSIAFGLFFKIPLVCTSSSERILAGSLIVPHAGFILLTPHTLEIRIRPHVIHVIVDSHLRGNSR